MKTPRSDDDPRDLVRAVPPGEIDGPEAVAHLLEQSNREAVANRAQARELIRALEGVQRSQEYLGTALREERAKSKWLLVLVLLAPVVAAAGAWFVWRHVDDANSEMTSRLAQLAADQQAARAEDAARLRDGRVAELATDIDAFRRDLGDSRDALAAERRQLAEREAALKAAESRTDSAHAEIGVLEYEVRSAQSKTSAEAARAAILENRIRELQTALDAAVKAPPPALVAPVLPPSAPPGAPPVAAKVPFVPGETKASETRAPEAAGPPADPAAVEKVRTVLNVLLKDSGDAVRYQFAWLGGVAGRSLTDVKLVGSDDQGAVIRKIEAARAEIVLDPASGSVVIRFYDGKLLVGAMSAPFFDGAYGLIVRGDPAKWKASGLDCLKSN